MVWQILKDVEKCLPCFQVHFELLVEFDMVVRFHVVRHSPAVIEYNLVNVLPGIIHLPRKLRKPHSFCIWCTVTFFLDNIMLIKLTALSNFSMGTRTNWFMVSMRKPKKVNVVVAQNAFSKDTGCYILIPSWQQKSSHLDC